MIELIEPHGGKLQNLYVDDKKKSELKQELSDMPIWDLTMRQVWDVDLMQNGAFSPLEGFLTKADYDRVCAEMRLANDTLWPIPITLDVSKEFAEKLQEGGKMALRHPEGLVVAVLNITDIWEPDFKEEAESVYATTDAKHPAVGYLFNQSNPVYVGGKIEGLDPVPYHTYRDLRLTPMETRAAFEKKGWERICAFQTRNPLHRAHVELTRRAIHKVDANLLLHPVVGLTKPGDLDYFSRVRCYQAVVANYPERRSTMLSLLPLAMRMGGPREALWHTIIRKNFGCTHFIVGRDHAGPGVDSKGEPFYSPYAAQELVWFHEKEIGIKMVDFQEMVYVEDEKKYMPRPEVPEGAKVLSLSGTELRKRLRSGDDIPEWFSYPEVIEELRRSHPPRKDQGITIFFTGIPGSGKTTVASILISKLLEYGGKPVTLLDGDIISGYIANELGHTKHDSEIEVKRIGFVASEVTKNRGITICAPVAPYEAVRQHVREMVSENGGFVEVYLSSPLELAKERDRKNIYGRIDSGEIKEFAGITDGYEPPSAPEITIDSSTMTPEQSAQKILLYLEHQEYISSTD